MSGLEAIDTDGWVAYVDELKGKTMVRLFEPYQPQKKYDNGANISIYNSSVSEGYLETEIRTPLVKLKPGQATAFSEEWAATTCYGPILKANNLGAVSERLNCNLISGLVSGNYGVFYKGYVEVKIFNKAEKEVYSAKVADVSPTQETRVHHIIKFVPNDIKEIKLLMYKEDGSLLGELDNLLFEEK